MNFLDGTTGEGVIVLAMMVGVLGFVYDVEATDGAADNTSATRAWV